ncbi:hypothetical protein [Burkholderia vietnamiensis]|uniref:hypothetical protein n=1 Tax=Burkholderia vietnamiensis TaxID=60552 RepID=UPI001CF185D8|nr:hypothetical protein [Burkholderia vietnamiensis]MCA7988255.1 hypothetical protein [Burkholderia vietnamiensis]HDR8934504.1 hypothetical protein [Burkholderia vietnamiensis]
MTLWQADIANKQRAFLNAVNAVDFEKSLPNRIFGEKWKIFLFFQSDYIFSSGFVEFIRELLCFERAEVACMLNLDQTETLAFEAASAIFIDKTVSDGDYQEKLRAGGPAAGWLFGVDRYVCASDIGRWCIYSEKSNDVAVVGLCESDDQGRFVEIMNAVSAKSIEDLVDGGRFPLFPFDQLVPEWRKGLLENYGVADKER